MEVFSFGNADFLFQVFTALANILSTNSYMTLVKLTITLGILIVAYQAVFSLRMSSAMNVIKQYFVVIILVYAFLVPKANVVIYDEFNPGSTVVVNNVPFGVSLFAHLFTTAEKGLTRMMETWFTTPNDLKFGNSGYAFSVIALDYLKDATPVDPYFKRTLDDFVYDCFFHDVLWGDKNLNTVITSNNVFGLMVPQHSATILTRVYDAGNPNGQLMSCQQSYQTINGLIGGMVNNSIASLSTMMRTNMAVKLPTVVQSLLNVGMTAQQAVLQAMVVNGMKESFARAAMYTGVSGDALAYATALGEQQQRSSWLVAGEQAKKYIPIMRQILEAVVYGLFPVLFVMMMTPWGLQTLRMYVTLLIWLLMWSPLFALLNLIVNTRITGILAPAANQFSIGYMPYIYQSTADVTAMAGYMAWLVPTLSFAIAKASDYAIVNTASSIAGSTGMASSHAASAITGPEGAQRTASAAGQYWASAAMGQEAVMSGFAAKSFYNVAHGAEWNRAGSASMREAAGTQVEKAVGESRAVRDVAGATNRSTLQTLTDSFVSKYMPWSQSGKAMRERGLAESAELKAFDANLQLDTSATLKQITDKAYGGDTSRLAQMRLANDAAEAAVFRDPLMKAQYLQNNMQKSVGQIQGEMAGFLAARERGFRGDFKDYNAFMSEVQSRRTYEDAAVQNTLADKHFGGDKNAMFGALAAYHGGQAVAALSKMSEHGYDPETAGMLEGHLRGLRSVGSFQGLQMVGEDGVTRTVRDEMVNEAAKFVMREKIAQSLGVMKNEGDMKGFFQYMKWSQGQDAVTLGNPQAAERLTSMMKAAGARNFAARQGDVVRVGYDLGKDSVTFANATRGGEQVTMDANTLRRGYFAQDGTFVDQGFRKNIYNAVTRTDGFTQNVGNDIRNAVFTGNVSKEMHGAYDSFFVGREVNPSARAYANAMAETIRQQGDVTEIATEALQGRYGAGVSASLQKALNLSPFDVGGSASLEKVNEAISRSQANVTSIILNARLQEVMRLDKSSGWKQEQMAKEANSLLNRIVDTKDSSRAERVLGPVTPRGEERSIFADP